MVERFTVRVFFIVMLALGSFAGSMSVAAQDGTGDQSVDTTGGAAGSGGDIRNGQSQQGGSQSNAPSDNDTASLTNDQTGGAGGAGGATTSSQDMTDASDDDGSDNDGNANQSDNSDNSDNSITTTVRLLIDQLVFALNSLFNNGDNNTIGDGGADELQGPETISIATCGPPAGVPGAITVTCALSTGEAVTCTTASHTPPISLTCEVFDETNTCAGVIVLPFSCSRVDEAVTHGSA